MAGLIDIGSAVALPLTKIVGDVLNRILPGEKMSEFEKAKIALDVAQAVRDHDWRKEHAEFEDRASARALAMKDTEGAAPWAKLLGVVVRPVWGFASLIVVAYPYLAGALNWPAVQLDEPTTEIVKMVIMFYFGGRTIEKVMETVRRS